MNPSRATQPPSFKAALRFWARLGWSSFGGTAAHIAIMHDFLVERQQWISNSRFLNALSHCMLLPGPEAQQLAIYVGWKLHGKKGGVAAGILFVLPSMFIVWALSVIYVRFGQSPSIAAMFGGLKPGVIALVIVALFRVARRALRGVLHGIIAVGSFVAMFYFDASLVLVMLGAIVVGLVLGSTSPSLLLPGRSPYAEQDEREYFINQSSKGCDSSVGVRSMLKLIAIAGLLWLVPLALFYAFANDFAFWKTLTLFFTKTAFVTIGGSYTVLPYVAQVTVTKFHWLTKPQMTDGFALAETTPGPLIIVVAFVGFMAGYNHFHHSLCMGTLGLLATTFYTFLPCFLFIFCGAPMVERIQDKPVVEGLLGLITAVVVGAILDLTVFLGRAVLVTKSTVSFAHVDLLSVVWIVLSVLLLTQVKLNALYLVVLSLLFGASRYLIERSLA